jgi:hypothetical protein
MIKYIHHFLKETVHLLLYFMMGVSVLSIVMPWFGYNFDYVSWGNGGGFSIACDIIFIERFYFNKRYCWLTRKLPIAMIFINFGNILCNELYPKYYELYGQLYEIVIFSLTLFIFFILFIEKTLKK